MKPIAPDAGVGGVYRRCLPAAEISIQANTPLVPADGQFHLVVGERILYSSSDLEQVEQRYDRMCAEFWDEQLHSPRTEERVQAAMAILHRDPGHAAARAVIEREGSDPDRKRLQELDRRAAFRRRAAQRGGRTAAPSSGESQ